MDTTADRRARTNRRLTLVGVVAAHVLLVVLLLVVRGTETPYREGASLRVMTIRDTSGAPAAPAAAKRLPDAAPEPRPSPVVLPLPMPPLLGGSIAGSTAGAGAVEGGCAVAATIGQAIEADPQAIAALLALPPEARSSADAVNLWNGRWLQVPTATDDSLAPVRSIVEQAFAQSDPACIEAAMPGPQFIYVKVGDRTLTLVAGSGNWRWSDMLHSDRYEPNISTDASNTATVIK